MTIAVSRKQMVALVVSWLAIVTLIVFMFVQFRLLIEQQNRQDRDEVLLCRLSVALALNQPQLDPALQHTLQQTLRHFSDKCL